MLQLPLRKNLRDRFAPRMPIAWPLLSTSGRETECGELWVHVPTRLLTSSVQWKHGWMTPRLRQKQRSIIYVTSLLGIYHQGGQTASSVLSISMSLNAAWKATLSLYSIAYITLLSLMWFSYQWTLWSAVRVSQPQESNCSSDWCWFMGYLCKWECVNSPMTKCRVVLLATDLK